VTAVDGVSVREESHQCPNVIWVTFPIPYQRLLTMKDMKFLKGSALTPRSSFGIGVLFNLFIVLAHGIARVFMVNLLERWIVLLFIVCSVRGQSSSSDLPRDVSDRRHRR